MIMDLVFLLVKSCLLNYLILRDREYFIAKIKECENFAN